MGLIQLLTSYGFMLEDNPYDVLPISLAADDDDPFAPQKAALLQALGRSCMLIEQVDSVQSRIPSSARVDVRPHIHIVHRKALGS